MFSQTQHKVFINSGISVYPSMKDNAKNYNISVSYHWQNKEKWSWELMYFYSQNNYFPNFFNDEKKLDAFILSRTADAIYDEAYWESASTHHLGSKIHYAIYKNNKFNFSANFGIFLKRYANSVFSITNVYVLDTDPNDVVGFSYMQVTGRGGYGAGLFSGLHADYNLGNNFLLGFDGGHYKSIDGAGVSYTSTYNGNLWTFSLGIGKKF